MVDGGYSNWSAWGGCDTECGIGRQWRLRSCNNPKPKNGGKDCKGEFAQTRRCEKICRGIDRDNNYCKCLQKILKNYYINEMCIIINVGVVSVSVHLKDNYQVDEMCRIFILSLL